MVDTRSNQPLLPVPAHTLTDQQFARIAPLLPGKPGDRGRTARDNRLFLEAVLFVANNG
ncbi:MAG: transposase, partial [Bacteroidota bacterium]